jgi:dihydroorotase
VELLRNAKAEGLAVTCDVSMYHLCFCDEDLLDYSTQLKFHPPLRSADDRAALRAAVADGTIDAVVSDHQPWEIDRKDCEFALAAPGAIGTQGLFSAALHAVGDLERVVYALTQAPRKCLRLPEERIEPGRPANLTVFDPHARWTWNGETNLSFSNNTPFWNQPMQGKALATIAGMAHVFNTYF